MKCSTCGKANCMAHGGDVDKRPLPKPKAKEDSTTDMYEMSPDVPAMHGMDEGGEADESGLDDELNDMAAGEFLDAIEKKDKTGIIESIRALILSCGGK